MVGKGNIHTAKGWAGTEEILLDLANTSAAVAVGDDYSPDLLQAMVSEIEVWLEDIHTYYNHSHGEVAEK